YKLDADDIAKGALDPNNLNIEDRIRQLLTSERRWSSDFVVWVGKWAGRRHPKKAKRRKPAEPTLQDYWPTTLLQSCDLPLQGYDLNDLQLTSGDLDDLKLPDFGDLKLLPLWPQPCDCGKYSA